MNNMKEEILLLKIHNAIKEGKDHYQAVCGNWKMSEKRLPYIQYVAGINNKKVVCVFKPIKWSVIEEGPEKGRKCFKGTEAANEVLLQLQAKEEQLIKKFGSGSAIAYASSSELE